MSDKLSFLTSATEPYAPGQHVPDYNTNLKNKISDRVKDTYPWLEDFRLSMVDVDKDNDYAYGAGQLKGYSSGFRVEFPFFWIDGALLDIPAFILPERKLTTPFNEVFFKLITATLNDTDGIGRIREKEDVSSSLLRDITRTDNHPVAEIMKLSSFAQILSFMPRRIIRSYAKTACSVFPELTRDFYAALKLSKTRANIKHASSARQFKDKIASARKIQDADSHPSSFVSITTPVFLSEAEAKERQVGVVGKITQISENSFVLPEANNKLNLVSMPDFQDITRTLNEEFEYVSPVETLTRIADNIKRKPHEGVVVVSPSTMMDYWMIPSNKLHNTQEAYPNGAVYESDSPSGRENAKARALSVNNIGGEFLYDETRREFPDIVHRLEGLNLDMSVSRVVYFPASTEKRKYYEDILSKPLCLGALFDSIITSPKEYDRIGNIPFLTSRGTVISMDLRPDRELKAGDLTRKTRVKDGKKMVNLFFRGGTGSSTEEQEANKRLPDMKVVADEVTGEIETIYYRRSEVPSNLADWNFSRNKDYLILDLKGLKTIDPEVYTLSYDGSYMVLSPLPGTDISGSRRKIWILTQPADSRFASDTKSAVSYLIRKIFDPADLDKDFILNTLPCSGTNLPDFQVPYLDVSVAEDNTISVNVVSPKYEADRTRTALFKYTGSDDFIRALAHIGIEAEDLLDVKEELTAIRTDECADEPCGVKMGYALFISDKIAAKDLSEEQMMDQVFITLQELQKNQEQMMKDADLRDRAVEAQLKLMEARLTDVSQIADAMQGAPEGQHMSPEEEEQMMMEQQGMPIEEQGELAEEEGRVPPEVLAAMVSAVLDPAIAEQHGLKERELQVLQAAADGDNQAASEVGFSPADHRSFVNMVQEISQIGAMEGEMGGEVPEHDDEDIEALAQIIADPDGAIEGGLEQEIVESLASAVEGDEQAMQELQLTPEVLQAALERAENMGPGTGEGEVSQEEVEELAYILSDPEGAVQQGVEEDVVNMVMQAAEGDEQAMQELGLDPEILQAAMEMSGQQEGGEPGMGQDAQMSEEEVLQKNFENAADLITAYFEPDKMEELQVAPEDLGIVTIVLRSPAKAIEYGVPGEEVQAIVDAYNAITGKSIYKNAEHEFGEGEELGIGSTPNISEAKNVISMSKGFEEYSKPVAQTSALLDILPKIKTAKLFFKNADSFREMLTILGETLINLQLNAIQYKEVLGGDSYDNMLARLKKLYEDFGSTILEMYSLDREK